MTVFLSIVRFKTHLLCMLGHSPYVLIFCSGSSHLNCILAEPIQRENEFWQLASFLHYCDRCKSKICILSVSKTIGLKGSHPIIHLIGSILSEILNNYLFCLFSFGLLLFLHAKVGNLAYHLCRIWVKLLDICMLTSFLIEFGKQTGFLTAKWAMLSKMKGENRNIEERSWKIR